MRFHTLLSILQQSEYDVTQLRRWVKDHEKETLHLEPEKWTLKLKFIAAVSQLFFFLPVLTRIAFALKIFSPFETVARKFLYSQAKQKLTSYRKNGLKVVAIAGSYAKTSTKNILTHSFESQIPVLATPNSYNTLLGIAQVIRQNLKPEHKLFIVEFGEYHPQDIPELTQFIQPDYGILTPIGRQHLEIIGGFENLVKSFSAFVEFFTKRKDDVVISEKNKEYFREWKGDFYGTEETSTFRVSQAKITRAGTEYTVSLPNSESLKAFTPVYGEHQAVNTLTSVWVAQKLHIDPKIIVKRFYSLPYITRRHEPQFAENNVLILDNSYNTNPESVVESLKLVNQLEPTHRFIVTLGFTELGKESDTIHFEFGQQLAKQVDYVGLIKAPWSDRIIDGFVKAGGKKDHIVIGNSQEEAFAKIQSHVTPGSVILFEGGYREVYV